MVFFIVSISTKKWENIFYSICFALLQIPMNWLEETNALYKITPNLGLIIRPIIIIAMICVLIISGISEKKKNMLREERI